MTANGDNVTAWPESRRWFARISRKRRRPSGNPSQRCPWASRNPGCGRKGRFDNRRHDPSPNERRLQSQLEARFVPASP